jgi:hypothetical protein
MSNMTVVDDQQSVSAPMIPSLMQQFLAWVETRPRSYEETMEAWRTHCPRFTIWEDALGDGLVRVESGGTTQRESRVMLTPDGRAMLAACVPG